MNFMINNVEVTDKNTIDFLKLCSNSVSDVLNPLKSIPLSENSLEKLSRILYRYGLYKTLKMQNEMLKNSEVLLPKDVLSTVTVNLDLFYKSFDKVIEAINNFYWLQYYCIPKNITEYPMEFKLSYNVSLIVKIKQLKTAIDLDDWPRVGYLLASLDIDSKIKAGNNPWYAQSKTLETYNLLWENLFFIGFQRILLRDTSPRMKAISLELMLNKFCRLVVTESFKIRKLLPMFFVSVMTFGIAHNNKESVSNLLKIKISGRYNEPELNYIKTAYQLYFQYSNLVESDDPDDQLQGAWSDLFSTMIDFFDSASEKHMKTMLFLFEPLLVVSIKVEEEERALDTLILYCKETPALLPYCGSILKRVGLGNLFGRLTSECIEHDPSSTFLHRFPLIVHYVSHRTEHSRKKGIFSLDDAEKHVRMMFNFLDYGKNRTIGTAWRSFKLNLESFNLIPGWVYEEWNERQDWWPSFHNVPLDENYFELDRDKVFSILRKQNRKRKL